MYIHTVMFCNVTKVVTAFLEVICHMQDNVHNHVESSSVIVGLASEYMDRKTTHVQAVSIPFPRVGFWAFIVCHTSTLTRVPMSFRITVAVCSCHTKVKCTRCECHVSGICQH